MTHQRLSGITRQVISAAAVVIVVANFAAAVGTRTPPVIAPSVPHTKANLICVEYARRMIAIDKTVEPKMDPREESRRLNEYYKTCMWANGFQPY